MSVVRSLSFGLREYDDSDLEELSVRMDTAPVPDHPPTVTDSKTVSPYERDFAAALRSVPSLLAGRPTTVFSMEWERWRVVPRDGHSVHFVRAEDTTSDVRPPTPVAKLPLARAVLAYATDSPGFDADGRRNRPALACARRATEVAEAVLGGGDDASTGDDGAPAGGDDGDGGRPRGNDRTGGDDGDGDARYDESGTDTDTDARVGTDGDAGRGAPSTLPDTDARAGTDTDAEVGTDTDGPTATDRLAGLAGVLDARDPSRTRDGRLRALREPAVLDAVLSDLRASDDHAALLGYRALFARGEHRAAALKRLHGRPDPRVLGVGESIGDLPADVAAGILAVLGRAVEDGDRLDAGEYPLEDPFDVDAVYSGRPEDLVREALTAATFHDDPRVRRSVVDVLGFVEADWHLDVLADDDDEVVRRAARAALEAGGREGESDGGGESDREGG